MITAAQQAELSAEISQACSGEDPVFRHRLFMIERSLNAEILKEELTGEFLLEKYEPNHPDVVASRLRHERISSELQQAAATLRADCQENMQVPGRWIPEGVTLDEWRGVKSEIQLRFNAFDVLTSSLDRGSQELLIEGLDFDVRFLVYLIKQNENWEIDRVEQ